MTFSLFIRKTIKGNGIIYKKNRKEIKNIWMSFQTKSQIKKNYSNNIYTYICILYFFLS